MAFQAEVPPPSLSPCSTLSVLPTPFLLPLHLLISFSPSHEEEEGMKSAVSVIDSVAFLIFLPFSPLRSLLRRETVVGAFLMSSCELSAPRGLLFMPDWHPSVQTLSGQGLRHEGGLARGQWRGQRPRMGEARDRWQRCLLPNGCQIHRSALDTVIFLEPLN